jgi:deoxyadenosine/deoxycytidine kinase
VGAAPAAGKRFIAIAGNIGAGKTELTKFLCRRYGIKPFFEPNEQNPYLADFYSDMKAWAYKSQLYFLANKFRLQLELQDEPGTVVQDRTIYEDAEIFAKNLRRQRAIDGRDFKVYWQLYRSISAVLRPPDLMIQLSCPVRTLRQRIRLRGRAMEQEIPATYLGRLNRLYVDWFRRYDLSPALKLPTDRLDWMTDLVDRADLFRQIERYLH